MEMGAGLGADGAAGMPLVLGTTKLLGVIGDPIAHSLSPVMHNRAIAALGADFVYVAFPITAADLDVAIAGFRACGVVGFSVTIPHKRAIMPLLTAVADEAAALGAVNTVWWDGAINGWRGTNTDVAGLMGPLQSLRSHWNGEVATVLGCGGAARAAIAACQKLGFERVRLVGRNEAQRSAIRADFLPPNPLACTIDGFGWDAIAAALDGAALVVNATPVGMHPHGDNSPIAPELWSHPQAGAIAYDLIYNPRPTKFLKDAQAAGLTAIDGLEMLAGQGAAALSIWLGQPAPLAVMRQALIDHLGG